MQRLAIVTPIVSRLGLHTCLPRRCDGIRPQIPTHSHIVNRWTNKHTTDDQFTETAGQLHSQQNRTPYISNPTTRLASGLAELFVGHHHISYRWLQVYNTEICQGGGKLLTLNGSLCTRAASQSAMESSTVPLLYVNNGMASEGGDRIKEYAGGLSLSPSTAHNVQPPRWLGGKRRMSPIRHPSVGERGEGQRTSAATPFMPLCCVREAVGTGTATRQRQLMP